jgi:hypothetical protein
MAPATFHATAINVALALCMKALTSMAFLLRTDPTIAVDART